MFRRSASCSARKPSGASRPLDSVRRARFPQAPEPALLRSTNFPPSRHHDTEPLGAADGDTAVPRTSRCRRVGSFGALEAPSPTAVSSSVRARPRPRQWPAPRFPSEMVERGGEDDSGRRFPFVIRWQDWYRACVRAAGFGAQEIAQRGGFRWMRSPAWLGASGRNGDSESEAGVGDARAALADGLRLSLRNQLRRL